MGKVVKKRTFAADKEVAIKEMKRQINRAAKETSLEDKENNQRKVILWRHHIYVKRKHAQEKRIKNEKKAKKAELKAKKAAREKRLKHRKEMKGKYKVEQHKKAADAK